jgi:hypothetical protein
VTGSGSAGPGEFVAGFLIAALVVVYVFIFIRSFGRNRRIYGRSVGSASVIAFVAAIYWPVTLVRWYLERRRGESATLARPALEPRSADSSSSGSGQMWCPQCGAEYRLGFTQCADCAVDLVEDPQAAVRTKCGGSRRSEPLSRDALAQLLRKLQSEDKPRRAARLDALRHGVIVGASWGLLLFIAGLAQDSVSFSQAALVFVKAAVFLGSLSVTGSPRTFRDERTTEVAASVAGVDDKDEREEVSREADRVIREGGVTADPVLQEVVLACADVQRRTVVFDRAAIVVPLLWIGWYVGLAADRWRHVGVGRGAPTLLLAIIPALYLYGHHFHRTYSRRAAQAFENAAISSGLNTADLSDPESAP